MDIDSLANEIAHIKYQLDDIDSRICVSPTCDTCFEHAPYGDERNLWLGYHLSWYHKLGRKITEFFLA